MFSYHRLREEGSLGSHQMRPPLASFCLRDLSFPICKPRSLNGEAEQPVFHLCILWLAPSLQNLKEISPDSFPLFWGPVRTDKGGSFLDLEVLLDIGADRRVIIMLTVKKLIPPTSQMVETVDSRRA